MTVEAKVNQCKKDNKTINESQWESAVAPDWYIYFTMCLCVNCKVITAERVIYVLLIKQEAGKVNPYGQEGWIICMQLHRSSLSLSARRRYSYTILNDTNHLHQGGGKL